MKRIILTHIVALLFSISYLFAQNPVVAIPVLNPNPLIDGGAATGTFSFYCGDAALPAGGILLEMNITYVNTTPTSAPSGPGAAYFDWTYLSLFNVYQGVQNQEIPYSGFPPTSLAIDLAFDVNAGTAGSQGGYSVALDNVVSPPNLEPDDDIDILNLIITDPLPVELLSFTGRKVQNGNLLEWITASEENNEGFEVQESEDGVNWKIIGWVEGQGTTAELNNYEFLDRITFIGNNYYRLKQLDFDGAFEFSNIINLKNEGEGVVVQVLPNPSPGDVNVTVLNPNKEKMSITLYDSAGLLIWQSDLIRDLDVWKKEFNLVQKEVYFISVQIGKETYTEKILIIDRA